MSGAAEQREDAVAPPALRALPSRPVTTAPGATSPGAHARKRPDPRPMRLVYGAGALAALSVMSVGLVHFSPATTTTAVTASDAPPADPPQIEVRHVIRYIHLKPGQVAPPGATVITPKAPAPQVVVTHVAGPLQSRASSWSRASRGAHEPGVARHGDAAGDPRRRQGSSAQMPLTLSPDAEATWSGPSMGGRLDIRIAVPEAGLPAGRQGGSDGWWACGGVGLPPDALHVIVRPGATQCRTARVVHGGAPDAGSGPRVGWSGRRAVGRGGRRHAARRPARGRAPDL